MMVADTARSGHPPEPFWLVPVTVADKAGSDLMMTNGNVEVISLNLRHNDGRWTVRSPGLPGMVMGSHSAADIMRRLPAVAERILRNNRHVDATVKLVLPIDDRQKSEDERLQHAFLEVRILREADPPDSKYSDAAPSVHG